MAQLLVPSQYSTIQAAITACASGDEIVVSAGTYNEVLTFTSKNNVLVRAVVGDTVTVTGTGTIVPFPSTCHRITFLGITFVRTGTSALGLVTAASTAVRGCKFIDCIFDFSGMGAMVSTTVPLIALYPGDANSPSILRRCRFVGNGATTIFARMAEWATASVTNQTILVECNTFYNVQTANISTAYMLYLNGNASTGGRYVARNNSFHSCKCFKTIIRVVGNTAAAACYNNVTQNQSFWSPASANFIFICPSGAPTFCGYNTAHNSDGVSTTVASPDSGNNDYNNPVFADTDCKQTVLNGTVYSTPLYRTGVALSGGGERRVMLGRNRIPFAATPSRGAHEAYATGRGVLHLKYKYVNVMNGMVFNMTGQAAPTLPSTNRAFTTPMEIAEYVETSIRPTKGLEYGPIEFWYDFENYRYRVSCYQSTFELSCSGNAAIIFGSQSLTAQTDTG